MYHKLHLINFIDTMKGRYEFQLQNFLRIIFDNSQRTRSGETKILKTSLSKTKTGGRFLDERSFLSESDTQGIWRKCGRNRKPPTKSQEYSNCIARIFSDCATPPPQLQSTCHYMVNHYVKMACVTGVCR